MTNENVKVLYVDIHGLMTMLSLGRNSCLEIGQKAGALMKIGNKNIYSVQKVADYMEKQFILQQKSKEMAEV